MLGGDGFGDEFEAALKRLELKGTEEMKFDQVSVVGVNSPKRFAGCKVKKQVKDCHAETRATVFIRVALPSGSAR